MYPLLVWVSLVKQNNDLEGSFFDVFSFSLNFTAEPESSPGSTRVVMNVEITVFVLNTDAVRVVRALIAIRAFSQWNFLQ